MEEERKKSRTGKILFALLLTIVLTWLLLQKTSTADIYSAITSVPLSWLLFSLLLYIMSTTFRALRFMYLVKGIPFFEMLKIVYLHNLSNNLLPSFLGEFSFVYLARKTEKTTVGHATAALVVSRVFDLMTVFALTLVALLLYTDAPKQFQTILWVFFAFIFALLILLIMFALEKNVLIKPLSVLMRILRQENHKYFLWAVRKLEEMAQSLREIHGFKNYLVCAITSLFVWLLAYCQTYVLLYAMGYQISFLASMLGTSIYRIASSLPVYGIGGFGTVELTWSTAFVLLGMKMQDAITSSFSTHIILLIYSVVLGMIALMIKTKKDS